MILYAITLSPFAARVRLALRVKKLDYAMQPPPGGGTRSPEYLAINPIGKLPVLVTDDGLAIAESETIIDYLDERFPAPSLLPADTAERVRMRNIVRSFELYATPAMSRLFKQMDPATRRRSRPRSPIGATGWRSPTGSRQTPLSPRAAQSARRTASCCPACCYARW